MILETEKELRQVVQVAVATALGCWGFPILALLLVLLILPWQPFYRMAAYLGSVFLDIKAKRTVKRAMRKLNEEPVQVT
jgi:Na+-transporting NADH:ubiquinone oxidoreductase subunit NqrB